MELNRAHSGTERSISRRVVAVFKEHVGRGPTKARTMLGEDVVLVILHDTLTKAEHTLADDDRPGLVREMRRTFQGTMRDAMIAVVEEETGHKVKAFLSDHSIEPDYAVEVFILADREDQNGDGPLASDIDSEREHPDAAKAVPDAVRSGDGDS